jgi:general secretion pathway protein I
MRRERGFTLLEVLVALTILAVALAAAIRGVGEQARGVTHLRDKSLAHWVALNQLAELRLQQSWPASGRRSGEEKMADQRWYWQIEVSDTADPEVRRIDIRVGLREGESLAQAIGFAAQGGSQR